jgi:hypothetical protein
MHAGMLIMHACVQVKECLMFSAQLRLPSNLTTAEKNEKVNTIIDELVRMPIPALLPLPTLSIKRPVEMAPSPHPLQSQTTCFQGLNLSLLWSSHPAVDVPFLCCRVTAWKALLQIYLSSHCMQSSS